MTFSNLVISIKRTFMIFLGDRVCLFFYFIFFIPLMLLGTYNCMIRFPEYIKPCMLDGYMYTMQPGFCSLLLLPLFCFLVIRVYMKEMRSQILVRNQSREIIGWNTNQVIMVMATLWVAMIFFLTTIFSLLLFAKVNNWSEVESVYFQLIGVLNQTYSSLSIFLLTIISLWLALVTLGQFVVLILNLCDNVYIAFVVATIVCVLTIYSRSRFPFLPIWLISYSDLAQPSLILIHCTLSAAIIMLLAFLSKSTMSRKDFMRA